MTRKLPLVFLFLLSLALPSLSASTGFRARLIHTDTSGDLKKAAKRSKLRLAAIAAKLTNATRGVQAPVHEGFAEFIVDIAIGTPAFPFLAIVDTGSDLIWTQCSPCFQCFSQPTNGFYNPSKSSTFSLLPCSGPLCQAFYNETCAKHECSYFYGYGDGSSTQGVLASETLTFDGGVSVPDIGFGCGVYQIGFFDNSSGILGLGMGPLSLISQLCPGRFSYCLDSDPTKTSPLLFGSLATISNTDVQSTPIYQNQILLGASSYYYLNLTGITVGDELLPIPSTAFAIQEDGTGGIIIDSGTTFTALFAEVYQVLRQAFVSQTNLTVENVPPGFPFDLCFSLNSSSTSVTVPTIILHLEGADLNLQVDEYLGLAQPGLVCLLILPTNGTLSILGNTQQLDTQILYDLDNWMLSFAPAKCDRL